MDSKFFKISKKIIAVIMVAILLGTNVSSAAYSFMQGSNKGKTQSTSWLNNFISPFQSWFTYDGYDLQSYVNKQQSSGTLNYSGIFSEAQKIKDTDNLQMATDILGNFNMFSSQGIMGNANFSEFDFDLSSILSGINLSSIVDLLLGLLIQGEKLPVKAEPVQITAQTAGDFAGSDYEVKLNANIYRNGKSNKWALLIHPFMLNSEAIVKAIGAFYYDQGFNVIAPDLRGFGDSEGSVALGFLESLDVYDWLWYLNEKYKPSEVIVHGVSLGAATTNFLSGIDQFILEEDKARIERELKPLRELKVIGLVEDCGYAEMTQFAPKMFLDLLGIGIEDNFDYYSNAEHSLEHCDLPILIIHGTSDTMVKYENAAIVQNAVLRGGGKVVHYKIEGGAHAGILMGSDSDTYKQTVQTFILQSEGKQAIPETGMIEITEDEGLLDKLLNAIKGLFNF